MASVQDLVVFTPHHAIDAAATTTVWMRGSGVTMNGAGVTYETTPTPPQGTTLGERWIKFDGNSAVHDWYWRVPNSLNYPDGVFTIDTTKRWAARLQFLFRHGTSAGVGDTLPTADAVIWSNAAAAGTLTLYYTTTGKLRLVEGGVDVGTGSTTLTVNTNYIIEIWEVRNNNAGVDLANNHFVVRLISGFGGALTITNEVDALCDDTGIHLAVSGATTQSFGEVVARGANFVFYVSQMSMGFEDADDPYGIVRVDRLDINGVSALRNEWGGTAADIDEDAPAATPTTGAVPDATDTDSVAVISPTTTTARQLYLLSSPSYAVSADAILVVNCGYRKLEPVTSKNTQLTFYGGIADGTTDRYGAMPENESAQYQTEYMVFELNHASAAWAHADLAGLEVGVKVVTTDTTSRTAHIATITTFVGYRKSGETTAVVPSTGEPQTDTGGAMPMLFSAGGAAFG